MANKKYTYRDISLEHIRNRHETKVIEIMHDLLPEAEGFCGCQICVEDVFALSLNALPALYAHASSIIVRRDPPTKEDMARAVNDALDKVRVRPNHPE